MKGETMWDLMILVVWGTYCSMGLHIGNLMDVAPGSRQGGRDVAPASRPGAAPAHYVIDDVMPAWVDIGWISS